MTMTRQQTIELYEMFRRIKVFRPDFDPQKEMASTLSDKIPFEDAMSFATVYADAARDAAHIDQLAFLIRRLKHENANDTGPRGRAYIGRIYYNYIKWCRAKKVEPDADVVEQGNRIVIGGLTISQMVDRDLAKAA
jgi:hypothetical protein